MTSIFHREFSKNEAIRFEVYVSYQNDLEVLKFALCSPTSPSQQELGSGLGTAHLEASRGRSVFKAEHSELRFAVIFVRRRAKGLLMQTSGNRIQIYIE
jgi:hypothetical protein